MDPLVMEQDPASEGLYWHVQDITSTEAVFTLARGLARNLGVEWVSPFRLLRSRIRFEDVQRRPFLPPSGDIHHRNETLTEPADGSLYLHTAWGAGPWTVGLRVGVSVPLGRTEPNPFALGRLGLPHQHIQFGTGTWDPILGLGAGRRLGETTLTLQTLARVVTYENEHGYRAGNRYHAHLMTERRLGGPWRGLAGLDLIREAAEEWDGRREEEGNLGRTDLLLRVGVARPVSGVGGLSLSLSVPLVTRATGSQLDYPVVVSVGWSR